MTLVSTKEIYIYICIHLLVGGLQYDLFLSRELQYNLIRSHAAGVGTPLNTKKTRMLLALRINVLAKGHSGISLVTLYTLIKAFNGKEIMLSQQFSQNINYHV
jgi:Histidine ammonia-lyase